MTKPGIYLARMLLFLAAVVGVAGLLSPVLITAFRNNPGINSLILLVLALGIAWNLHQVTRLRPEVTWLETFRTARPRLSVLPQPKLLAPMANMLAARNSAPAATAQGATPGDAMEAAAGSRCLPARCAACSTASPRGSTKAASCRAT